MHLLTLSGRAKLPKGVEEKRGRVREGDLAKQAQGLQRCNPSDLGCHDDTPWIWLPEQGSSPGLALDTKPVEDMPLATPLPGSFPSPLDRKWWSSSKTGSKRKDGLASHWPVSLGIMKTFFFSLSRAHRWRGGRLARQDAGGELYQASAADFRESSQDLRSHPASSKNAGRRKKRRESAKDLSLAVSCRRSRFRQETLASVDELVLRRGATPST